MADTTHTTGGILHTRRSSSRAKRLGLTVYPDSRVVIVVPQGMSENNITRFISRYSTWIRKQLKDLEKYRDHTFLPSNRHDYLKHKERARAFVHACLRKYNTVYCMKYNRVSIKNLRRNWGSCSAKQNLNFNYKLIHLPEPLAEYIVVHELCHLAEFNHSKRFWTLVMKTIPDHKARKKALKRYLV
ncbi:M48 family metallopeptidase [Patescibacteria group bacterium]